MFYLGLVFLVTAIVFWVLIFRKVKKFESMLDEHDAEILVMFNEIEKMDAAVDNAEITQESKPHPVIQTKKRKWKKSQKKGAREELFTLVRIKTEND